MDQNNHLTGDCPVHGEQDITSMGAESVTLACGYVVM